MGPSKRVLTQNPSPEPTPPPFTCSQSTSVGLTPEPTATGRSCTKVELRSSGQKCWRLHGRKSLPNGPRGQRQDCQNGLVSVQAKRLEIQRPLRVRKMQLQRKMRKKTTMRRKKKRRRRKRRSKQISLFDSLTAILRESNHYRCNFESFHTGHCFYTKLVIA